MHPAVDTDHSRLSHTPLFALHRELGARMVPFAGYEMPVQFPGGIKHEHRHTRMHAGLFDISHMGQIRLPGAAAEALEALVPGDVAGLPLWRQRYTVFTNRDGGIIDDLMITRTPDGLHLIVNAARKEVDLQHLREGLGDAHPPQLLNDRSLLALQGPESAAVLSKLAPGVEELRFLGAGEFAPDGIPCLISRSGYTGEDGFEMSLGSAQVEALARRLLQNPAVEAIGLGARDSLRLEAGLCLYGHDLDETTSPVEAGLAWVIARRYGGAPHSAHFPGAQRILAEMRDGPRRCRVGIRPQGRVPVREGLALVNAEGEAVGKVSSGSYGASVDGPIAMAYVAAAYAVPGTELYVHIRGRAHRVRVTDLPFVRQRYRR